MKSFKAIGFDYGGVIKGAPSSVFVSKACKILGITEDKYHQAYYNHNKKFNRNEVDRRGFWNLVLAELNKPELIDEVVDLNNATFNSGINVAVLQLSDSLRVAGYKTGLLTNNTLEAGKKIREEGIDKHFDVLHVSAETGDVKPEPNAFVNLAKDLGVDVAELVYIDDSPKSISSADEVGYTGILFTSYDTLIDQLKNIGISVE